MTARYEWSIEPLDLETNEALARELPEENCSRALRAADDTKHDVWQCEYQQLAKFIKGRKRKQFRFRVFNRTGKNTPLRLVDFLFSK